MITHYQISHITRTVVNLHCKTQCSWLFAFSIQNVTKSILLHTVKKKRMLSSHCEVIVLCWAFSTVILFKAKLLELQSLKTKRRKIFRFTVVEKMKLLSHLKDASAVNHSISCGRREWRQQRDPDHSH